MECASFAAAGALKDAAHNRAVARMALYLPRVSPFDATMLEPQWLQAETFHLPKISQPRAAVRPVVLCWPVSTPSQSKLRVTWECRGKGVGFHRLRRFGFNL